MSADTNPGCGADREAEIAGIKSKVARSVEASFTQDPELFVVNAGAFMKLSGNEGLLKLMLGFQSGGIVDPSSPWRAQGFAFGYVYHDRVAKSTGQTIDVIEDDAINASIDEWNSRAAQENEDSNLFTDRELQALRFRRGQVLAAELDPALVVAISGIIQSPFRELDQPLRQGFVEGVLLVDRMIKNQRKKIAQTNS
jgi:hypothetical protein